MIIKRHHKILFALLIVATGYLVYSFLNMRNDLFRVYDVEDRYALSAPDADLTIVDFSKYGCPHCQKLHPVLMEAIKKDGKIRYIPKIITFDAEFETSIATLVYAAAEQGKFIEMHNMVFERWPIDSLDELMGYAKELKLDIAKLQRDMSDPAVLAHVKEDQEYFKMWDVGRTPSLLVGDVAIYRPPEGGISVDELLGMLSKGRQ